MLSILISLTYLFLNERPAIHLDGPLSNYDVESILKLRERDDDASKPRDIFSYLSVDKETHSRYWVLQGRAQDAQRLPTLEEAWRVVLWMRQRESHWWSTYRPSLQEDGCRMHRANGYNTCPGKLAIYDWSERNNLDVPLTDLQILVSEFMEGALIIFTV